jgi:hypothetical protein
VGAGPQVTLVDVESYGGVHIAQVLVLGAAGKVVSVTLFVALKHFFGDCWVASVAPMLASSCCDASS